MFFLLSFFSESLTSSDYLFCLKKFYLLFSSYFLSLSFVSLKYHVTASAHLYRTTPAFELDYSRPYQIILQNFGPWLMACLAWLRRCAGAACWLYTRAATATTTRPSCHKPNYIFRNWSEKDKIEIVFGHFFSSLWKWSVMWIFFKFAENWGLVLLICSTRQEECSPMKKVALWELPGLVAASCRSWKANPGLPVTDPGLSEGGSLWSTIQLLVQVRGSHFNTSINIY